jgi:hypothetical protein
MFSENIGMVVLSCDIGAHHCAGSGAASSLNRDRVCIECAGKSAMRFETALPQRKTGENNA